MLLIVLSGLANGITENQSQLGHSGYSVILLFIAAGAGAIFGIIATYIYAVMLSWTGELFNGKANTDQFVTILAWSQVPLIAMVLLMVPKLLLFGVRGITDTQEVNQVSGMTHFIFDTIAVLLSLYTFIILVKGIVIIQGFNIVKAILNALLPGLLLIMLILMVIGVIYILK